jgi:ArsR family transcriptional regulator
MKKMASVFKALGHEKRLKILEWLKDPVKNFQPQKDGDLVKDGVCVLLIAEKLGVRQPTATQHLKILLDAKLLTASAIVLLAIISGVIFPWGYRLVICQKRP